MARIEVNSNDLDLLYDEMQNAISKIDTFTSYLAPGFNLTKKDSLYDNGFKKIIDYENVLKENIKVSQTQVKDFRDELDNIERVYTEKFESMLPLTELNEGSGEGEHLSGTPSFEDEGLTQISSEPGVPGDDELEDVPILEEDFDDIEQVPLEDITGSGDGEIYAEDDFIDVPSEVQEVPLYNMNTSSYGENEPGLDGDLEEDIISVDEEPEEDELTRLMRETEEANNMSVTEGINSGATDTMSSLIGGDI